MFDCTETRPLLNKTIEELGESCVPPWSSFSFGCIGGIRSSSGVCFFLFFFSSLSADQ